MIWVSLLSGSCAVGTALLVTPAVRSFAIRHSIGDYPGVRKVHTHFIPRLGGLAIILGFIVGLVVAANAKPELFQHLPFRLDGVIFALLLIVGLGIYDDVQGIGSLGQLIVQVSAASLVIGAGLRIDFLTIPFLQPIPLGPLSIPLTML